PPTRRACPLPHAVMHVARELLRAAGQATSWGRVQARGDEHVVLVAYDEERSGLLAVELAAEIVDEVRAGVPATFHEAVRRVARERRDAIPGPSTKSILDEAARRGIPYLKLDDSHYQLGHGARQQRIQATLTSRTSAIGVETADDKVRTKDLLRKAGVRTARGDTARTLEDALRVADDIGYPVVVKPREGNHGRGVSVGVANEEEMAAAFERARDVDREVIVEEVLQGADYRILVVGHQFVAAARRDPAQVVGDGVRTIQELVDVANADPRRGEGHENVLTRIDVDDATLALLAKSGLTLQSVPAAGQVVVLKTTANLSTGGTATDVTDVVHPSIREMAERVSHLIDLDVCGIDIVARDISVPLERSRGGVCEVNAAPGFRMHLEPTNGKPRNVAAAVIDSLFPPGTPARIPIVAVTGTNGKTTTSRLVAHVLAHAGGKVGLACTDGVEVRGRRTLSGDYSGPGGAEAVLMDRTVTHAVLEVARGGILRRGLGFDQCDVGLLLNVESDHLGSDGVDTLEDLAHVKSTVIAAVKKEGAAVLNAEDPLCRAAAARCRGSVVLFALDPENEHVRDHVARGGEAVIVRDGFITRLRPAGATCIARVDDVPITMRGRAECNVRNALAATAAALALGLTVGDVATALSTFHPTPTQLPGRLNLFEKSGVKVLVDYGHNPAALRAIESTLSALHTGRRIVSASATGNRRDEDLREFGAWLARLYDDIVLSDPDPRGRPSGETAALVEEGIRGAGKVPVDVFRREDDAIEAALALARPGDLVVLQAEDVPLAIEMASQWDPDRVVEVDGVAPVSVVTQASG
ncbi:MAG TPA: cyanophycin synthetase, partial [Candidatus Thermoplasmatota archaeon]|nr:cyanophycin synthetase [Candidatus Thermoplasmatota archaeon]